MIAAFNGRDHKRATACQGDRQPNWAGTRNRRAGLLRLSYVNAHRTAVAAAVVACLLAGGCGSLRAGGLPGPADPAAVRTDPAAVRTGAPGGSPAATAAGNRELARKQALVLLSLVHVPGGAVRLGSAPRSLPGPALGTPAVSSLVDRSRSWRVPMPFAQAVAWLGAQRPGGLHSGGLHRDGSMSQWGTGGTTINVYSYGGPRSTAWHSADLEIEVAPAGSRAIVFRADGLVVWLDPGPVRDTGPGRRMRVTIAGGCPPSDRGFADVANSGPGLASRLLPGAAPAAGLECRYHGMNGPAWRLRSMSRLNAAAAGRVATSMTRLPLSHPVGGVLSCPMDDSSAEVIALSYPGRPDVDLWINLNGCGGVSNRYILAG